MKNKTLRLKIEGQYQRRYSSGIQMYRERNKLIRVPKNTVVKRLKDGPRGHQLVEYKEFILAVPNENFSKPRSEKPVKAAKKTVRKERELEPV